MLAVANEDLEDGHAIQWRDVSTYVKIYPSPYNSTAIKNNDQYGEREAYGKHSHLTYEVNTKGKKVIYVENALTGELTPVLVNAQTSVDFSDLSDESAYDSGNDDSELFPMLPDKHSAKRSSLLELDFPQVMAMYLRVVYSFIQGILAGFSFTTLYFENAANPSTQRELFLQIYSPLAGEIRRYFFILTCISLVGSLDTYLTVYSSSSKQIGRALRAKKNSSLADENQPSASLFVSFVVLVLHVVCFVVSLRMAVEDTIISTHSSAHIDLGQWSRLNSVRYICAVVAWMGSSQVMYNDLHQKSMRERSIGRLKEACVYWRSRYEDFIGEGPRLASMSVGELSALSALQKKGEERTASALKDLANRA